MNKQETKTVYKNSFPVFGLVFLIMLTLKLLGKITFSWWWVTAPLWGPLALSLVIVLGVVLFAVAINAFTD